MRIALVTSALNPGGIAEVICSTAIAFARDGNDVLLCALRMAEITDAAAQYRKRLSASPGITLVEGTSKSLKPIAGLAKAGREMREALEAFKPDVVHAHGEGADLAVALFSPRGVARVRTAHIDYYLSRYLWLAGLLVEPAINILGGYNTVVGISEQTMKRNRWSAKTALIHNGVFDETRQPHLAGRRQSGVLTAGIVGTLLPHKGQAAFLKVLKRRYPNHINIPFRVRIFGDGPDRQVVARLAGNLHDKISLSGHVENRDEIYAGLDVLLIPSTNEGLSTAMLEAVARSIPVFSLPVAGAADVISRWNCGEIVSSLDDMIDAIANNALPAISGEIRSEVIATFSTAAASIAHEKLYKSLVDRP
jgi:glycosyltransferase involved in cell wall biosynthesis